MRICDRDGCDLVIPAEAAPQQKFCRSAECDLARARIRDQACRDKRRSNRYAECRICGTKFHTATLQKLYCSYECDREAENAARRKLRPCRKCGDIIPTAPRLRRLYCLRCKPPSQPTVVYARQCPTCGVGFKASGSRKRYCSKRCGADANVARYHEARLQLQKPARSATSCIITYLLERDQGRCHLCGKKVDAKANRRKHPKSATIDHLVPFSISHDSSLSNLALAHRRCNMQKNNRPAGEQLLLIG